MSYTYQGLLEFNITIQMLFAQDPIKLVLFYSQRTTDHHTSHFFAIFFSLYKMCTLLASQMPYTIVLRSGKTQISLKMGHLSSYKYQTLSILDQISNFTNCNFFCFYLKQLCMPLISFKNNDLSSFKHFFKAEITTLWSPEQQDSLETVKNASSHSSLGVGPNNQC